MNNPDAIIMVRPANFGFNWETAESNKFQNDFHVENAQNLAVQEFDAMVELLRGEDIDVRIFDDSFEPIKPDAIFPNNWISTHEDGRTVLYPMEAKNRRLERRTDIYDLLPLHNENACIDLTHYENENKFLEGTGSIIFDHSNKTAYCAISSRSNVVVFEEICKMLNYRPISFEATDLNGFQIYHTNVLLSIGENVIVFCSESVENPIERAMLLKEFENTQRLVVQVSQKQMNSFAANCLEVNDKMGNPKLIMSKTAFNSLSGEQISAIESYVKIVSVAIPTIEKIGGGSARCMMLGVHEKH